ncbi:MAG: hypothetical protein WA628_11975 [Terriglobales bacterium]
MILVSVLASLSAWPSATDEASSCSWECVIALQMALQLCPLLVAQARLQTFTILLHRLQFVAELFLDLPDLLPVDGLALRHPGHLTDGVAHALGGLRAGLILTLLLQIDGGTGAIPALLIHPAAPAGLSVLALLHSGHALTTCSPLSGPASPLGHEQGPRKEACHPDTDDRIPCH